MNFSDNAMSAILLCSYIGINSEDILKPLSLGEWNDFLSKVIENKVEPSIVLKEDIGWLKNMQFSDAYINRIRSLVSRGVKVAFELDDLSKRGIEVITLFDANYPILLRRKLKRKAPPVLFYAGDIQLAKKIGIAVVGSRSVDEEGIDFTKKLIQKAVNEKLIIYSGGAKGVDIISEETAIHEGGAVVSFVADSLVSKIKRKDTINNVMQGKLLLISDVKPETGFSVARAMNRNKYIYASAYGAFVIASDYNKGGTWTGAVETIRNKWTKVFVWNHPNYNGNLKLIEKGGISFALSDCKLYDIITKKDLEYSQLDIYESTRILKVCEEMSEYSVNSNETNTKDDLYELVKEYIVNRLAGGMDADEASKRFNVAKGQMTIWLKRLCKDDYIYCVSGIYKKLC